MSWVRWLLRMARGFRIGHPRHYVCVLAGSTFAMTGQAATLTYTPAVDNTPNQFTFTDQTNVALSSTITSAAVTISGLGTGVTITLNASGGTIDRNGDGNFLGSQIVGNGDTVRARVTSSGSNSTAVNCTVVASPSGVTDTFTATTSASGAVGFTFDSGWSGSGTFADGQDVTVTKAAGGLGFSTDPRPLLWIPGETSFAKDSTYSRSSQTMVAQDNAAIDSAHAPTNAAGSIRQSWPFGSGAPACFFANDPIWTFSTQTTFVSVKRMHDWKLTGSPDPNDKTFRVWPTAFGAPDLYHKIYDSGSANIVEGYTNSDDALTSGSRFFTVNQVANTWYQDEHCFKDSGDNTFDGISRFYRNCARDRPESVGWRTRNSSGEPGSAVKTQGYLDQFSNPASSGMDAGTRHVNICHVYIDDKLNRFTVSSEASFTQTTMNGSNDPDIYREIQLPRNSTGSDTSCGLRLRKGTYSSLTGLYLWFWPADGSSPQRVGVFT